MVVDEKKVNKRWRFILKKGVRAWQARAASISTNLRPAIKLEQRYGKVQFLTLDWQRASTVGGEMQGHERFLHTFSYVCSYSFKSSLKSSVLLPGAFER